MTQNCAVFATQQQQQQQQQQQHEKQRQQQQQQKCKTTSEPTTKHNYDILLNNFHIKKRRFRVLLNYDHIVWERLEAKHFTEVEPKSKKECEIEAENLSNKATNYASTSKVVHIDDIIRVTKGNSKHATQQYPTTSYQTQTLITQPTATAPTTTTTHHTTTTHSTTARPTTEQYLTICYATREIKSETDCNRWRMRTICFYNSDALVVEQWYAALVKMLKRQQRVQRLLVFINPYGGRKQGLQVYERYCKPLFKLAGIDASCIISQRANQIRDILMSHDLRPYDAVCCVGGDGTVAEVINGLIFREIRDQGLDNMRRPENIPRPSLPVGIIPAGSTDTVAYSLHGTADVLTAAIHLVLGQRRGLDICSVRNRDGILRFCASVLSYGYLGDVAAKSEKYRWMGTKRYEYTGVKAFLLNRGYDAEIRMLLPNEIDAMQPPMDSNAAMLAQQQQQQQQTKDSLCYVNCQRCNEAKTAVALEYAVDVAADEKPTTSSNLSLQAQKSDDLIIPNDKIITNTISSIYNEQRTDVDDVDPDDDDDDEDDDANSFRRRINKNCDSYKYNRSNDNDIDDVDNDDTNVDDNAKIYVIDNEIKQKHCTTMQLMIKNNNDNGSPQQMREQVEKLQKQQQQQHDNKLLEKTCDDIFHEQTTDANALLNKDKTIAASTTTMAQTIDTRSTYSFCSNSTAAVPSSNINNNNNNNNDTSATFEAQPNMQWKIVKGTFFMISGANITCACSRSPNGIARYSHLGDGHLDLILVRKTSLMNNVRFVINTMGRNGDIRNLPFVEVYRTRKFHFRSLRPAQAAEEEYSIRGSCQPITNVEIDDDYDDENVSRWNCDGEVVSDLDIIMSSHCQLIDVFMRGPHPYVKNSMSTKNSTMCCCG